MITEDLVITEDPIVLVLEAILLILNQSLLLFDFDFFLIVYSAPNKKGLFDQKPEGIPEELLNSDGAMGAMAKLMNSNNTESKAIRRLLITNLPTDYQETVDVLLYYHP